MTIRIDPHDVGEIIRKLAVFEGLEDHIPLFVRESFIELIDDGTITVKQMALPDAEIPHHEDDRED